MKSFRQFLTEGNRVAEVNAVLASQGSPYRLRRGRGYYYFIGGDSAGWPETSVYVYRAEDLTLDRWLWELETLKQKHKKLNEATYAAGDCFANVNRWMRDSGNDTDVICHGMVTNQAGQRFAHAWIERGSTVIDPTTDTTLDQARYYRLLKVRPDRVHRYAPVDALRLQLRTGHHGPWATLKESYLKPDSNTESDPRYYYHATSTDHLDDIKRTGLKPFPPHYGTDQSCWPDGTRKKRIYLSKHADKVWMFAPEEGRPCLLRVPKTAAPFKQEIGTGDIVCDTPIPAKYLEVLTDTGWTKL